MHLQAYLKISIRAQVFFFFNCFFNKSLILIDSVSVTRDFK